MDFWILFAAFLALGWAFVVLARSHSKLKKQNSNLRLAARDRQEVADANYRELVDSWDSSLALKSIAKEALLLPGPSPQNDKLQIKFAKAAADLDKKLEKYGFDPEAIKEL